MLAALDPPPGIQEYSLTPNPEYWSYEGLGMRMNMAPPALASKVHSTSMTYLYGGRTARISASDTGWGK